MLALLFIVSASVFIIHIRYGVDLCCSLIIFMVISLALYLIYIYIFFFSDACVCVG